MNKLEELRRKFGHYFSQREQEDMFFEDLQQFISNNYIAKEEVEKLIDIDRKPIPAIYLEELIK